MSAESAAGPSPCDSKGHLLCSNCYDPDADRRERIAKSMAEVAGSKCFRETGYEWEHMRSAWYRNADAALAVVKPELTALREELEELRAHKKAWEEAPQLRHCLWPGCLHEFDVWSRLSGKPPARPSWSGEGWRQMRPTIATGYICPTHAPLIEEHRPRWDTDQPEGHSQLRCACGWVSARARWHRLAVAGWQDHLIPFEAAAVA